MELDTRELDQLQLSYKAAVERWIAAIRKEETLASTEHSVAQIDQWEDAALDQDQAGNNVKSAKKAYEDALREKFFDF